MNKKRVDGWLLKAKEALEVTGIAKNGKISGNYRAHISAFGAAVTLGSVKSAVAFFAAPGAALIERPKLLRAMYYTAFGEQKEAAQILETVCTASDPKAMKAMLTDASIALKLAMNFFELDKGACAN